MKTNTIVIIALLCGFNLNAEVIRLVDSTRKIWYIQKHEVRSIEPWSPGFDTTNVCRIFRNPTEGGFPQASIEMACSSDEAARLVGMFTNPPAGKNHDAVRFIDGANFKLTKGWIHIGGKPEEGLSITNAERPCVSVTNVCYDNLWHMGSYFEDLAVIETVTRRALDIHEIIELMDKQPNVKSVFLRGRPAAVFDREALTYPQSAYRYQLTGKQFKMLQDDCRKKLKESPGAHEDVIAHWKSIVAGKPPFGLDVTP